MKLLIPRPRQQVRSGHEASIADRFETASIDSSPARGSLRTRSKIAGLVNDCVPPIDQSPMHHAQPLVLCGPLRLSWYMAITRNLFNGVVGKALAPKRA